jgi:hypothetical protein
VAHLLALCEKVGFLTCDFSASGFTVQGAPHAGFQVAYFSFLTHESFEIIEDARLKLEVRE